MGTAGQAVDSLTLAGGVGDYVVRVLRPQPRARSSGSTEDLF